VDFQNEFCDKIQGENGYFPLAAGCGEAVGEGSFSGAPWRLDKK